jgi:hypothetical protein
MNTYLKTLDEFIEKTNSLWNKDDDFQQCCIDTIELSQRTLCELKSLVHQNGFHSPEEEIILFKQVKPKILSMLFASRCILQYEIDKLNFQNPQLDDLQKLYLDKLQTNFTDYNEFRFYLSSSSNNRDSFYFTMNMSKDDMVLLLVPEAEKNFSTGFDIVAGYIQAYEFTKSYFECVKLRNLDRKIPELQWTGNKTDLVEILMVLHKMKLFNHGKNDMKTLAEAFSKILNFEIKDLYRTISAIKDRKKDNSVFLRQMIDTFQQIMNESSR